MHRMDPAPELAFRRAMGAFATGVTVVSAAQPDGRLVGMTVNSLTSVSLQPPLVLWCLGDKSARYDAFASVEHWGVTMLGADEQKLAQRYARSASQDIPPADAEAFAAAYVLRAGVAHLACRTHDRRVAGDHLIIIGEVVDFRVKPGAALTFFRGRYGRAEDPGEEQS